MKNVKCLLGFHDWSKPEFKRFTYVVKCERCGKKKEKPIPLDVWLKAETLNLTLHLATFSTIFLTKGREPAEAFLEVWLEKVKTVE